MEKIKRIDEPELSDKQAWKTIKFRDWETPEDELESNTEYQNLIKICGELGLVL